jgi:hypothetical protein
MLGGSVEMLGKQWIIAAVLGLAWACGAARANQPDELTVSVGTWQTLRSNFTKPEIDVDYRFGTDLLWKIRPHVGGLYATDGDYYGFAGFVRDFTLSGPLMLTLNTAIGGYGGNGYKLGSHFEFRNGAEFSYRFDSGWRAGVGFYHISNAGITRDNGGSESALFNVTMPFGH